MMRWLPLAMLAAAVSFPAMFFRERYLPNRPPPEKLQWQPERSWTHNMKDDLAAWIRHDIEYWMKLFCFVIGVQLILAVLF